MVDLIATTVCDSIGRYSPRLHTQKWRHPKFNHQEALRHRMIYIQDNLHLLYEPDFSFSVSSSRAIPFPKMLAEARDPVLQAAPVYWGEAQKGMSPGKELDDEVKCIYWPDVVAMVHGSGYQITASSDWVTKRECAKRLWTVGSQFATVVADVMVEYTDIHKSVPNRMVENYVHVNCLASGTTAGWLNFFGLRLDGAADPTLRALAEQSYIAWCESEPKLLEPGQWHLPYADDAQSFDEACNSDLLRPAGQSGDLHDSATLAVLKQMSAARCAHLSYEALDTGVRLSVERCLDIAGRLGGVPLHASPFEHQATPDTLHSVRGSSVLLEPGTFIPHDGSLPPSRWDNPHLAGNFGPGWVQLRKQLPGEMIAPLPEAYHAKDT